jgi:vacuolar protein sorting-associated protein 13A/C
VLELRDVKVKKTALDAFDLPIIISHAHIGSVTASIPWRSLGSAPVVASVSDVYLVVQPRKCEKDNAKARREREAKIKKRLLASYEEEQKLIDNPPEPPKIEKKVKASEGFISRLIETVTNNVQLHIKVNMISRKRLLLERTREI